jgi:phage baseplate assembly protein W
MDRPLDPVGDCARRSSSLSFPTTWRSALPAPHLAAPFRVENGRVATVEQDSPEEIRQCILACLRTKIGSRLEAPDYGVPDQTFKRQSRNPSAAVYLRAVEEAEPRARLLGSAQVEGLIQRVLLEQKGSA